ncbi:MAG: alanine racemase [Alphaproteobacteria bacterium]|nr:alanine racemase [Alphaproteobacteria bacterium]
MTPEQAGAFLTVDLNKIANNWRKMQAKVGDKRQVAAVLKTDAYGLGAERVGRALYEAGCRVFFTAYVFEGIALREVAPEADIYVLHGVLPHTELDFLKYNLIPVLSTPRQVADWNHLGHKEDIVLPAALHVDTGMTRLGLTAGQIDSLGKNPDQCKYLNVKLVVSHLACADDPDNGMNAEQLEKFETACAKLRRILPDDFKESLSATDGCRLDDERFYRDVVRPGIALYDGALSLEVKILQIQDVQVGQTVGYGATHIFTKKSRVATLGIGYGDGLPRSLSNKGYVLIAGHQAPIVGRISMDLTTVDVTDIDVKELQQAPMAEIFGEDLPLKDVANIAGTIDYEMLTNLSKRFFRIYLD